MTEKGGARHPAAAGSRLKSIGLNLGLSAASLLFFYLLLELVLFRFLLPRMPLRLQGFLPEAARTLAQSSKRGLIPKDYVAVLGDSYAQGAGDWLLGSNQWRNPIYAAYGILHERTGRDVVTFGQSGAGSLESLVAAPVNRCRYLQKTVLYKIGEPKTVLAYFYEGNDLNDNLEELRLRFRGRWDRSRLPDPDYFREFLEEVVLGQSPIGLKVRSWRWYDNLLFLKFARNLVTGKPEVGRAEEITDDPRSYGRPAKPGKLNRALVGGKVTAIPDSLISPALELSPDQVRLAVQVFERSLAYLKRSFPRTRIKVVYIPSPLSCYQIVSSKVSIRSYYRKKKVFKSPEVRRHSDLICAAVREAAERQGCDFIDTRETIRRTAAERVIHGPLDWKHLNKDGQQSLAEAIIPFL